MLITFMSCTVKHVCGYIIEQSKQIRFVHVLLYIHAVFWTLHNINVRNIIPKLARLYFVCVWGMLDKFLYIQRNLLCTTIMLCCYACRPIYATLTLRLCLSEPVQSLNLKSCHKSSLNLPDAAYMHKWRHQGLSPVWACSRIQISLHRHDIR